MNKKLRPDVLDDAARLVSPKDHRKVTDDSFERGGCVAEKSVPRKQEKRKTHNPY